MDFDLENELAKLQKIKELLGSTDVVAKSVDEAVEAPGKEEEPAEAAPEEEKKEEADEEDATADEEEKLDERPTEGNETAAEAEATEVAEEEAAKKAEEEGEGEEDEAKAKDEDEAEGEAKAKDVEEVKDEEEAKAKAKTEDDTETKEAAVEADGDADATAETKADESFKTAFEELDTYRKTETVEGNGYMMFFENKGKIVLDGESFVAYLNNNLEEVKKLYNKLQETESPKDQFFMKQEIIKKQDVLRKYMLSFIGKGELEVSNLPKFTDDILNLDVLKTILEKVSMENWSNQEDFTSFDKLTNDLKEDFYHKITPPEKYLVSIKEELEAA
jgi:hypothetical protein